MIAPRRTIGGRDHVSPSARHCSRTASLLARVCCSVEVVSTHASIVGRPSARESDAIVIGAPPASVFCIRSAKVAFGGAPGALASTSNQTDRGNPNGGDAAAFPGAV